MNLAIIALFIGAAVMAYRLGAGKFVIGIALLLIIGIYALSGGTKFSGGGFYFAGVILILLAFGWRFVQLIFGVVLQFLFRRH